MRFVLIALLILPAWAQLSGSAPEALLLARVREKMMDNLTNQPDYTCLETVERMRQAPGGGFLMQDTLRLEVALVDSKEMFSWPGAKEFEDKDIRELVSSGMFGNGNYGIYNRMLFLGAGPAFVYHGEVPINGRPAARYDFQVKATRSGYHLSVGQHEAVVGFHGSIFADPATADLRRVEIYADDIPLELGLTSSEDSIDYVRAWIGDQEFLLPSDSTLRMVTHDSDSRNHVRFSGCRKFSGESSLIFDDAEIEALSATPVEVREATLPVDVLLPLEIRSELKLTESAVGDVVTAMLTSDIRRGREKVAPKGAVAKGRVVQLDRFASGYVLDIRFTDLEWPGGHATVKAVFERPGGLAITMGRNFQVTPDGQMCFASPGPRTLKNLPFFWRTVP
ncbi:MAG: hypothetical protein ABI811_22575 [Acidobacteriota bacterium]